MIGAITKLPLAVKLIGTAVLGYVGYEKLVKKQSPTAPGTLGAAAKQKAAAFIHASTDPTALRQLATGLHRSGDPQGAQAAATKAQAVEQAQAPYAAAVSQVVAQIVPGAGAPGAAPATGPAYVKGSLPLLGEKHPHENKELNLRWQVFLKRLYPEFDYSTGPGTFGPHTGQQTRIFQTQYNISPATGNVGDLTWGVAIPMGA